MTTRIGVIAGAIALLATIGIANAQLAPQWGTCTGASDIEWKQQISACTTLINSGRETAHNLTIAYINRGLAYYSIKNFERAIEDDTAAIRLDPRNKSAYFNRGLAYKNSGDLDRGLSDYSTAIRLDPKFGSAYVARGNVYGIKKDFDRAIKDYDQAIKLNPKDALAYMNRGRTKEDKGDKAGAEADLAIAKRLNPSIDR